MERPIRRPLQSFRQDGDGSNPYSIINDRKKYFVLNVEPMGLPDGSDKGCAREQS